MKQGFYRSEAFELGEPGELNVGERRHRREKYSKMRAVRAMRCSVGSRAVKLDRSPERSSLDEIDKARPGSIAVVVIGLAALNHHFRPLGGPRVRIRFPPATSQQRTVPGCLAGARPRRSWLRIIRLAEADSLRT